MRKLFYIIGFCLLANKVNGLHYEADIAHADWQVSSSPFQCSLRQYIPSMGVAEFYQDAGDELRFALSADSQLPIDENVALSLIPPVWNSQLQGDVLRVFESTDVRQLKFEQALSEKMMRGLLFGMSVEFSRYKARAQNDSIAISPVKFREAYRNFQGCMAGLLPKNFEQISHSKIQFSLGQDGLTEADRRALKEIARYVQADKEVNAIYVDGYTDDVGHRLDNLELSRRRAEQVALYLIQQGVNPNIVALRYHGDHYPLAANNSAANRALNRRVTVRLDKVLDTSIRDRLFNAITAQAESIPTNASP